MTSRSGYFRPDYFLLGSVWLLVFFGLAMLSSASSVISYEKWGDSFYMVKHQIYSGLIPGAILFFIGLKIPYAFWRKAALPILVGAVVLLVLVLIPGIGTRLGGARSWFVLSGFSFQPSEFAKVALIFYLAAWIGRHKDTIASFKEGFMPFWMIVGMIGVLLLGQPDFGTTMIVGATAMAMYILAGASWKHIGSIFGLAALAVIPLVKIAPHRAARLMTFVHPEFDPQGVGYHINQALLAVGSGGLFGLGFGQSRQKFRYLPEVSGDSIFAIISEELGFFIATLFLVFLCWIFLRLIRLAQDSPDDFARFTILGAVSWFGIQSVVNLAAMLGLLPITGLPLPFISYGGTSLAAGLFLIGVIGNISQHVKK
ncbi:MAG: putative lipid II flippase FtsW [Patescibacteria group bacterium]